MSITMCGILKISSSSVSKSNLVHTTNVVTVYMILLDMKSNIRESMAINILLQDKSLINCKK